MVLHAGAAALDGDGGGCVRRSSSAEVRVRTATLNSERCPQPISTDRKPPNPISRLFDHDNATFRKNGLHAGQDHSKAFDHTCVTRVAKTQYNDADVTALRKGRDLAEVEIEGDEGAVLVCGLAENIAVSEPLQALLAEVYGVATLRSQPLCYTNVDTHVDEKTLAVYDAMTSSSASHAAYSSACCTSAASTSG